MRSPGGAAGALGAVVIDGFSGVLDNLADILLGVVVAMGFFADVLTEDDADGASTTDPGGS